MKKIMFLLLIVMQFNLHSQDSSALEFIKQYNKFRVENNLPTLEYSLELEEFAKQRIVVVSKDLADCYGDCDDDNSEPKCPGKNLHFKFIRMGEVHNIDSNKRFKVKYECAAMIPQFECYPYSNINNSKNQKSDTLIRNLSYSDKNDRVEYKAVFKEMVKEEDLPLYFLNLWINSPGHKSALLSKDFTHFGFKYLDVYYQGNKWVQGYWIAGKLKN
jgi:hypothetical protein